MAGSRYSLFRKVGSGGMAEVWKARAFDGGAEFVAIKKVLPSLSASRQTIEMLADEARLVAGLKHPNIVQVLDFARDANDYYIALEYVAGVNLDALQKRIAHANLRLPFEVGLYVILEACRGLGFAHASVDAEGRARNLIHRDVSPHNLLLSWDGEVKITDFGIAKVEDSLPRTEVGTVRGKAAYLSPEQAEMTGIDQRSDLFSLGLVMFELLAGRRLYDALSLPRLIEQIHAFRELGPEISSLPQVIQKILRRVLVRDRERRYATAAAMEADIAAVLDAGAAAEARRALAKILAQLFEGERRLDLGDARGTGPAPAGEPTNVGSDPGSVSEMITLTSALEPPPAQEVTAPRRLPTVRVETGSTSIPLRAEEPTAVPTDSRTFTGTRPPPPSSVLPTLALVAALLVTGAVAIAAMANFAPVIPAPAVSPEPRR